MISNLPLFQVYGAMARHAAESLKVSATNIAHADEPGYKATKIESFRTYLSRTVAGAAPNGLASSFQTNIANSPAAPNGNSVSLEQEVFNSAEAMGRHSMALTVYTKSMDLMRSAIGKGR